MAEDVGHVLDMDEPVPVDPGHVGIHLGDDHLRALHGRLYDVHADPQAHVPVLIGRRGLDQGDIDRHQPPG